jgi:hypothetical protein
MCVLALFSPMNKWKPCLAGVSTFLFAQCWIQFFDILTQWWMFDTSRNVITSAGAHVAPVSAMGRRVL